MRSTAFIVLFIHRFVTAYGRSEFDLDTLKNWAEACGRAAACGAISGGLSRYNEKTSFGSKCLLAVNVYESIPDLVKLGKGILDKFHKTPIGNHTKQDCLNKTVQELTQKSMASCYKGAGYKACVKGQQCKHSGLNTTCFHQCVKDLKFPCTGKCTSVCNVPCPTYCYKKVRAQKNSTIKQADKACGVPPPTDEVKNPPNLSQIIQTGIVKVGVGIAVQTGCEAAAKYFGRKLTDYVMDTVVKKVVTKVTEKVASKQAESAASEAADQAGDEAPKLLEAQEEEEAGDSSAAKAIDDEVKEEEEEDGEDTEDALEKDAEDLGEDADAMLIMQDTNVPQPRKKRNLRRSYDDVSMLQMPVDKQLDDVKSEL